MLLRMLPLTLDIVAYVPEALTPSQQYLTKVHTPERFRPELSELTNTILDNCVAPISM